MLFFIHSGVAFGQELIKTVIPLFHIMNIEMQSSYLHGSRATSIENVQRQLPSAHNGHGVNPKRLQMKVNDVHMNKDISMHIVAASIFYMSSLSIAFGHAK